MHTFQLRSVLFSGGMALLSCIVCTIGTPGLKPGVPEKNAESALLPALAPAPASPADIRTDALAEAPAYSPNFCASAQQLRHWKKSVITVRILGSETESKRNVAAPILKGMRLWNDRTAPYLTLLPTDADTADITISFVRAGSLRNRAVGQTDVRFRLSDDVLTRASIQVNEKLSERAVNPSHRPRIRSRFRHSRPQRRPPRLDVHPRPPSGPCHRARCQHDVCFLRHSRPKRNRSAPRYLVYVSSARRTRKCRIA